MKRRLFLTAASLSFFTGAFASAAGSVWGALDKPFRLMARIRPGETGWPTSAQWQELHQQVEGRLLKLASPLAECSTAPASASCHTALAQLDNPFYIRDQPALTQTSGWLDAWHSQPSAYAIAAEKTSDVVAAVNFARTHHLRLVIKGGGHSYQGTSCAADSLLIWTRHMDDITVHENFIAQDCAGVAAPQAAVTVGAGALWIDAYHKVTTQGGRYVQGGGCTTVGVAGLIQSGGFGNFSKQYGIAAANLLEAEVVTADGTVRLVNACINPDLFWAIKGGGGGSFGVITRVTLRVHDLPETFGAVFGTITASSDSAYQQLIAKFIEFYQAALFNPHWGEQVAFNTDNTLELSLVFQGMTQAQVEELWQPFLAWVTAEKALLFTKPFQCLAIPAQHFWDADYLHKVAPGVMVADSRAGAPKHHAVWEGDKGQAGWFIHGYQSAWLPDKLLSQERQSDLTTAIYHSSRHWRVALHFNKGLAGAPATALAAARDTAMNPDVLSAFALAIIAGGSSAAFTGMPNTAPNLEEARANAKRIKLAMDALTQVVPHAGSYVSESDYFNPNWQFAFWGSNYPRLVAVKKNYDPDELFMVHHGVGR